MLDNQETKMNNKIDESKTYADNEAFVNEIKKAISEENLAVVKEGVRAIGQYILQLEDDSDDKKPFIELLQEMEAYIENTNQAENDKQQDPSQVPLDSKADDDKGKGKEKDDAPNLEVEEEKKGAVKDDAKQQIPNQVLVGQAEAAVDAKDPQSNKQGSKVDVSNDSSSESEVNSESEDEDLKIEQNNDMGGDIPVGIVDQDDQQQDIFNYTDNSNDGQTIPIELIDPNSPINTVPMAISPETVHNAFNALKATAKPHGFSCFINDTKYDNVTRIERSKDNLGHGRSLLIHSFNASIQTVALGADNDADKILDNNYNAAAKSLGQSMWHFFVNEIRNTAHTSSAHSLSFPEMLDENMDIFEYIADPQYFREQITKIKNKLTSAQNSDTLSQKKYAEYERSLQEVEKWLDAIDEYCIALAERGISNIGTHYRKEQEKKALVIIKSLCAALVGLAVGYFGMLELAISQGWILQGVATGTTVLAQGQDAMIELYRQLLATNPEFILIAAISAAVLAFGAVALYHYFRDSVEPLTKDQQDLHDVLMQNPTEFFKYFSTNQDEARVLFKHQEVIQMLSGVVINEAKHPNSTGVEKQHFQDVSDMLYNIHHEMQQQTQKNFQQTSI